MHESRYPYIMKWIIFTNKLLKVKLSLIMILCLCILYSLNAQTEKKLVLGEEPVYKVSKAKGTITVDGKMNEASRENSEPCKSWSKMGISGSSAGQEHGDR